MFVGIIDNMRDFFILDQTVINCLIAVAGTSLVTSPIERL